MTQTTDGRWLTPRSPLTGEPAGTVRVSEVQDVAAAVARSHKAFVDWGAMSHSQRKPHLRAFAKLVLKSMDRISEVIVAETGKNLADAHAELIGTLVSLDFYTRKAEKLLRPKKGSSWPFLTTRGWTEYHPIGVVGIISPWNYPFYLPTLSAIQALSAGCTVVIKPSELTPLCGQLIADLALEAGLPKDVVQVIHGYGDTGAALVEANTDMVAFTGSSSVGKTIAAQTARSLKPVLLELGGKDAQIVLEDADIEDAARAAVMFGVFNAGQQCVGIERVYVVEDVYDQFIDEATKAVGRTGAATGGSGDIGPFISPDQADVVEAQLQAAVDNGARLIAGGSKIVTDHGVYFEPTLLDRVDHSMVLMQEETFGPVIPVMKVADEDEAIELANDSPYGLHGSVWTQNKKRGHRVASRMKTGTVAVNDHLINYIFPTIKFGGIGESGLNGHLGEEGIKAFSIHRSITSARIGPTTKLLRAWLPRRVGPRYWKMLARALFGWRR